MGLISSPSALDVLVLKRPLAVTLSANEISQSLGERCDGPAQDEACERSLTASPPFPVALAVSLLSFLRLQPEFDQARETGLIAGVYFLKTRARNDRLLVPHLDVPHVDQGAQITRVDRAELKAVRPDVP